MFRDRADAARKLAEVLRRRGFQDPLVIGIPRGGVVTGYVLANELDADLDIILARKIGAPMQPELAIGAVSEDGQVILNLIASMQTDDWNDYIRVEAQREYEEIERRQKLFRNVRPRISPTGRNVILTDDGIATGSTMIAALQVLRREQPRELIVAVPVASPDRIDIVGQYCDEVVCLQTPDPFWAVGQVYENFDQVSDDEVLELLRHTAASKSTPHATRK